MTDVIKFYFAVPSRYAYLASTQMDALGAETGCDIIWIPVDAEELRRRAGNDPFNRPTLSGPYQSPYRERDLADWVDFYDVAYREPPDDSGERWWRGFGWEKMREIALAAQAGQELGGGVPWIRSLYNLMFVDDTWPFDLPDILSAAKAIGLDPDALHSRINAPETSARLTANTEQAHADGAFGVPSFVWNGKLFFGNDRLVILKHQIAKTR